MEQAIETYKQVTVLPEFKEAERLRQKARLDEAQALQNAEKRGEKRGIEQGENNKAILIAQKMLKRGRPIKEIIEDTGLSYAKIEELQRTLSQYIDGGTQTD